MGKKWSVLAVYALAAGLSQFLWLSFAPLISFIERNFDVTEDTAGLLLMVFPATYILTSIPAGQIIDRKGYRFGIGLGLVLMSAFATARIFAPSFAWLLAAQVGLALGQPLIVNGISKLVLDWFGKDEEAIATGIGTVGMFVGMAVGMMASAKLVEVAGFQTTLAVFAGVSLAVTAAFLLVVRQNTAGAASAEAAVDSTPFLRQLRDLLSRPAFLLIFTLSFLGMGCFNGLTTWLEPILGQNGVDPVHAGLIGGCMIIGGIFGAAIVPALSDRAKRRKPFLIGATLAALALIYPLSRNGDFATLLALAAVLGFSFLPAYALMLQICADLAGPVHAGAATGILMLTGNIGGVSMILLMQWMKSPVTGFQPTILFLLGVLGFTALLAMFLKETHPQR